MMSTGESDQIVRAAKAFHNGEVVGLGSYTVSSNGGGSSSKKSVLASEFVVHHGIEEGDKINSWIHSPTGAMIILPKE